MDGETPSWLEEGGGDSSTPAADPEPVADPVPPPVFAPDQAAASAVVKAPDAPAPPTDNVAGSILASMSAKNSNVNAKAAVSEEDEKELPRMILFMRVLNMAAAVLLMTCSIVQLVRIPPISVWVMAIYATCGGLLVCCLEMQLKFVRTVIAMNFGFLFNSVYRFLFYCLMSSVTWSYRSIFAYITAITLGLVAVFNTYILCRYPAYRKMREKIAAEEDKRIQAKINQQVRKQAVSQMGWGKS